MSMSVALNSLNQIVHVNKVERGLACACVCLSCGESVVARKGVLREHHFSHQSRKASCTIAPESVLHRYAKQVIREAMGLQLPPMPGQAPGSEDTSSWWDFEAVEEEVWLDGVRPDLVARLNDGALLIEIAVTSFVDEEKLSRLQTKGIRAVEIDLREWLKASACIPSASVCAFILHAVQSKRWLIPIESEPAEVLAEAVSSKTEAPGSLAGLPRRFIVEGMWIDAWLLSFGALGLRSVAYNPAVVQHLKLLARRFGGRYAPKYRNWVFPLWASEMALAELGALELQGNHSMVTPVQDAAHPSSPLP
ncbi:competence protein CoiA family protein [Pseudomonas sp. NY15436]|uniref:competence protein CoiA family protein n=1 Tax=Pseudomonas TaxID=286 RepID=UPI002900F785|nr:competence protein CoiA family protein [Pseudomonas aeruginosa]MDU0697898.1 competence protein CoiA family protein [Pseudomonas aeruginosa]